MQFRLRTKETNMTLHDRFEAVNDDFLKFERIDKPRHRRPDLCAFILLDELVPGTSDIVSAAEHDEIFLDVDCDKLQAIASDDNILELVRCGVRFNREYHCLCMFV